MHLHLQSFGDFEGQPAAGYAGLAQNGRNRSCEAGCLELNWRDVDADDTDVVVRQEFAAHCSYCPAPEFQDRAGSFRDGNEQARRNGCAIQHFEAHQSLEGFNSARCDILDRLINERNEILADRDLQQSRNILTHVAALGIVWIEQPGTISTACFRQIKRAISLVDDFFQLRARLRPGECSANAHCDDRDTVSPLLVVSARFSTVRRMASAISATCSLLLHASQHDEFFTAVAAD